MAFQVYSPKEYLMIDIATNYGDADINGKTVDLDKVNFEDRIAWFREQEKLGTLASLITSADKPALYFAGLSAYSKMLDEKPIGYAISLDACSSGLQILATFSNCEKSAKRCGVVDTGQREDAYTSLFEDMRARAKFTLNATRKNMKQAVMTSLYGSTAQPKMLFGDGSPALDLFYEIMETEIPGAWELNLGLKHLWQPFATEHSWVVPDGFEVCMGVEQLEVNEVLFNGKTVEVYTKQPAGTPTGRSLSPNIVHSIDGMIVREIVRRCYFDANQIERLKGVCQIAIKRKERRSSTSGRGREKDFMVARLWKRYLDTGFFSARVLEHLDEENISMVSASMVMSLINTLPAKPFPVITIHDCFRVHPNYGNDLRRQYNRILSELAASNTLGDIATQISGRKQTLMKVGDISNKILEANYTLS